MRHAISLLTLGLLGLAGCVLTPQAAPTVLAPQPNSTPSTAPAPPPVRAEQITPDNAQKMSQALADELDREAQRDMIPPALPK